MKAEEKNVLMKVVWSSSVGLRRLHSKDGYNSVRRPVVIKVEKTAENKWELKIALDFDGGYPGQNLLFILEQRHIRSSLFGGRYPGPPRHFFGSYRCLQSNLLKDLLKLRQYLKLAKTVEEVEGLLKTLIKPVYWGYQGFRYSFDISCSVLPQNVKPKKIGLSRGTAKTNLEVVDWQNYKLSLEQLAIKDNLFLEKLQYSYSGEYVNVQLPLFSYVVPVHLLGFCMLPAEEFVEEAQGIYGCNERFEEVGIINANYYTPADGDEFRKVADWLQMAGIERKKNGERRKWTLEEECLFRRRFLLQLTANKD